MYAKVKTNVTFTDTTGAYSEVTEIVEEAFENNSVYTCFDLSEYSNGSEVKAGWRYYTENDVFAAAPAYSYYAVLDENGIVTMWDKYETQQTETATLIYLEGVETDEQAEVYVGKMYYNGAFIEAPAHFADEIAVGADPTNRLDTVLSTLESGIYNAEAAVAALAAEVEELQNGANPTVQPMVVATMHLGKLDNNNGAEFTSSTRICSDPFAVENGKSYWQVNDKAVNMYVLLYDADETFLQYLGNFASGAEIVVDNANAAYMRLGSLVGEYDLTNEFRIYDVDPASAGTGTVDAYTKAESDEKYAAVDHTHTGFAASEHTHDYAATDHTHTGYAAAAHTHTASEITGLPSSVDAYSKTEADTRFAQAAHTHDGYATADHTHTGFAAAEHTHTGFAAENHTHDGYAAENHTHDGYAEADHTHTAAAIGAAATNHTHTPAAIGAAPTSHTHTPSSIGAAAANHSHSEYADADHTHSGYAASNHTHDYLPTSGGTVTGETNFSGGLVRVKGVQTLFHSGNQLVFGSNNLPTRIAGNAITATQTITVDSDERLKENIEAVDEKACADFIKGIKVKAFNYTGSETECIGVIAQELKENPEFAKYFVSEGEDGYLGVKVADLVFPLIAAVQALQKQVDALMQ